MAQFKAFDKDIEVNGQTILSVVHAQGISRDLAYVMLEKNGIKDPKPGRWYSQQAWLDAFREISDKIGNATLFQIGKRIPENADWPPRIKTIEDALASIDAAYHLNHRKKGIVLFDPKTGEMREGIGHYLFEKTGDGKGKMVCENPYPCDFDRGIIASVAKKFKPQGSLFVNVQHDDSEPCRKNENESCTYQVSW